MKRIVEPDDVDYQKDDADFNIHCATYGISSDPLLLFTVVFSALIHGTQGMVQGPACLTQLGLYQTRTKRGFRMRN